MIFIGLTITSLFILCWIARGIYVGNWRHLRIDDSWDASQSKGRIKR